MKSARLQMIGRARSISFRASGSDCATPDRLRANLSVAIDLWQQKELLAEQWP